MNLSGLFCFFAAAVALSAQPAPLDFLNHNQPVLDAHNCYPYEGQYADRIERALKSGFPVAIEQDIAGASTASPVKGALWLRTRQRPLVTSPHSAIISSSVYAPLYKEPSGKTTVPSGR